MDLAAQRHKVIRAGLLDMVMLVVARAGAVVAQLRREPLHQVWAETADSILSFLVVLQQDILQVVERPEL
jgi:hypothetical protein